MENLITLIERCKKGAYDIYRRNDSSLSYCPNTFFVTKSGRTVAENFTTLDDARAYVRREIP